MYKYVNKRVGLEANNTWTPKNLIISQKKYYPIIIIIRYMEGSIGTSVWFTDNLTIFSRSYLEADDKQIYWSRAEQRVKQKIIMK